MKTIILALMLLAVTTSNAQKDTSTYTGAFTFSSMRSGMQYGNVPMVIKYSDGVFEVRGDSLTAIKMLWNELEQSSRKHSEQLSQMYRQYQSLVDMIDRQLKYQKQLVNDLTKSLTPISKK